MGFASKKEEAAMAEARKNWVPTPEGIEFDRKIVQCVVDAVAAAKARREGSN